ncbi:MAG: HDOD domain-containing protein [Phycisphaerales bacterium JB059]
MAVSAEQREQVVAGAIGEISHIATLPEITLKIIDLVEDPSSTAQDLHEVISGDPALCSRILKVVNSSFYGLPGQIASINRAIVMLGLNAVKNIAIAASLAKLFRGGELTPNFSAKDLWVHSNAVAAGSKLIADSLKLGLGDEAYLAGLIHDIGIMVEMQFDRNKLIEVVEKVCAGPDGTPTMNMLEVEEGVFGANHQDFGAALCTKWKFPAPFATVTGFHHRPTEAPEEKQTLVCVVTAADCLAAQVVGRFRLDLDSTEIPSSVREVLKLGAEQIESLKEQLASEVEQLDDMV